MLYFESFIVVIFSIIFSLLRIQSSVVAFYIQFEIGPSELRAL